MNNLDFTEPEETTMHRYQPAPPVVAPWFAYLVGTLVAAASVIFTVEVIRIELLIRDTSNAVERAVEKAKKN